MNRLENKVDNDQERNGYQRALTVKVFGERYANSGNIAASLKFIEAKPGKGSSLSGMGPRRITGAKRELVINADATNFGGMNSSGVVSARSGSRPGMDLLRKLSTPAMKSDRLSKSNRCGVSDINRDHLFPANAKFIKRIDNGDAFIKDNHFGAKENQPCAQAERARPERGSDATLKREIEKTLRGVNTSRDKDNSSENNSAARTKTLWISHPTIISWSEQR